MKIVSIVGARPNFVKLAPIVRAIWQSPVPIQHVLVHTGQHYDYKMSQVFFEDMGLPEPDYHLGIGSGTHAEQTGRTMIESEKVLIEEKPDVLMVIGDVNSTLAGALAAVKLHVPVAHVEAGIRMQDMEIPEEVNRVLTDHVSNLLFAPTQTGVDNLRREGIMKGVFLTGDTMLDSYLASCSAAERQSQILFDMGLRVKGYLLATVHRASNTDDAKKLKDIVGAFLSAGEIVVFPVHPRTRKCLQQNGLYDDLKMAPNMRVTEPVNYLDSITLMKNARGVLTDSGGLQREAYFAGVPCITLDETTGWVETVDDGWNVLVGADKDRIIHAIKHFEPKSRPRSVFGDGTAADTIVNILSSYR